MLLFCTSLMAVGLTIDLQSVVPQALGSLCSSTASFWDAAILHATLLPVTNLSMVFGLIASGVVSARRAGRHDSARIPADLGCGVLMLTGMFLGEWLGPQLARLATIPWTMLTMLIAMSLGMVPGILPRLAYSLYRRA